MKSSVWIRFLLALTALKLLGGVAGFAWGGGPPEPLDDQTVFSPLFRCLILLAFAAAGLSLLSSGREDRRAVALGSFFFLLAAPFAYRPLLAVAQAGPPVLAWPALFLYVLPPDAFLPYFFWTFSQEFPNSVCSFKVQKLLTWGRMVALWAGFGGVAWQVLRLIGAWLRAGAAAGPVTPGLLAPRKPSFEFYSPLLLLVTLAFLVLLWRTRGAAGQEGRRARLFVAGLVAGLAPLFLEILLETAAPSYREYLDVGGRRALLGKLVVIPSLMAALAITAYSVLVAHVLNVKLIARKAVQYALARYSAIGLAVVPLGALAAYLFQHRDWSLQKIFSGPHLPLLASSALVGMAALRYRKTLLDSIDRHFFREQYDARQTLTLLVERIRSTHGVLDLANLLCREADLALHPESVSLMAFEPRSGLLADPKLRGRRLDASSQLAALIASASDPLPVSLEDARSPLARLPESERHWLVDSGFRLLAPILARDGSLLGLIGLGEKKSGLPFFREDRQLLRAIASSAAWVLELELARSTGLLAAELAGAGGRRGRPALPRSGGGRGARQGVPQLRPAVPLLHRVLQLLQPAPRAVARALRAARQVPLRAADRHRRHGRRLPRHRPRPSDGWWRSRPCAASRRKTPCGCGARRARRPRSPTPTWRRSTAWRPGRARRCW